MITSRALFFLGCVLLFILSGCASRMLVINPNAGVKALGICVDFNEHINADEKLLYLNAVNELVDEYNRDMYKFRLETCNSAQQHQLKIVVQNTRFVDPAEQALYVVFSTAGLLYPLMGGKFFFAWLGFSFTNMQISASFPLSVEVKPINTQFYSSPYFSSEDDVRLKHMEKFKVTIAELVTDVSRKLNPEPPPAAAILQQ